MFDAGPLLLLLVVWGLGLTVLYWVVRLAVRHAIEDADRRRNQPAA
jgi:cytochrome c biogenesis protein CcdA